MPSVFCIISNTICVPAISLNILLINAGTHSYIGIAPEVDKMSIPTPAGINPYTVLELPASKGNPRNGEGDFLLLDDGRILFVYTEYTGDSMSDHAPAHIVGRFSADDGESWSAPFEIVGHEGRQNVMSVSLLRLDEKRIAIFFLMKNSASDCMPVMKISCDGGRTWGSTRECLPGLEPSYCVLNNSRVVRQKSGRILLPLSNHGDIALPDWQYSGLSCAYSDDNGETWTKGAEYRPLDKNGKPVMVQEPGVIELNDGRVYMYARTDRGCQWECYSSDGGETWNDFGPAPIPGPRGPATIIRLSAGELLLVWNDHSDHPEYMKAGPDWLIGMRTPLTLAISRDEGRTWTDRKNLETDPDGFYCYFGVVEVRDGILISYYNVPYLTGSCVKKVPYAWLYGKEQAPA